MVEVQVAEFPYPFILSDKSFKKTMEHQLTIHVIKKIQSGYPKIFFQVTVPKYIYEKVKGTSKQYLDEYVEKSGIHKCLDRKIRFKQWLRNENFHQLVEELNNIDIEARLLQEIEDSAGKKVIFVKYHNLTKDELDEWMHCTKGKKIESVFQFFVCYKKIVHDFISGKDKTVYESLETEKYGIHYGFKKYFDGLQDQGFTEMPWTEEREVFLLGIQEGFIRLQDKLSEYLGALDAEKLDKLIANKVKLLEEHQNG